MPSQPNSVAGSPTVMRTRGHGNNVAIAYCLITFAFSWTAWILAARAGDSLVEIRVFTLAVKLTRQGALELLGNVAPGLVAILMLLAGGRGIWPLLVQFRLPRCSKLLYLLAITIPIALNLLMLWAEDGINLGAPDKTQIVSFSKTFLLNLFLTPLWEEIGWRGYLLPTLSKGSSLGRAFAVTSIVGAIWHFALYELMLRVSLFSFTINFIAIVALSLILAILWSVSGQNLILPTVFHVSWNTALNSLSQIEPTFHAHALILQTLVLWAIVGIMWFFYRRRIQEAAVRFLF